MRHIIIEGPDGAGKTRLARWLCHRYTMAYHHEGPPPTRDTLHHYAGLLANATRPTVFDRLHLGELVYGPLLRGGSSLSMDDVRLMNRLVIGTGIVIVGCLPPLQTCLENNRAKDELIKEEQLLEVAYRTWELVLGNAQIVPVRNARRYDYTSTPWPFEVFMRDRLPDGVIGSPDAAFLFVGEQPNSGTLDLPFFGSSRSSGYLNERIRDAGLLESEIAFTNALDMHGHARDLSFIISQMPHLETVIPLGRVAQNQLERQGLPAFVKTYPMPHPQFWKRFHAGETREYTRMLELIHVA